ncbi:hypothetical protein D4768_21390 [Rhodococcus erythropolis]|uniref:hypothetical protein n=1 Tax=Rhodococcus erythropolis TaxID=1833 RepID=UPI001F44FBFB|nr:hypothetical protein [Rhodococcus erythropolis]UJC79948.1 hypothetical protein D4768_21390 [Rhodococcus erythropolis]
MTSTVPGESVNDDRIRVAVTDGNGHPDDLLNSVLTRSVAFIEALERDGEGIDSSADAEVLHVRELIGTISGVVLDFVREWPS